MQRKPHKYWLVKPYSQPLKVRNANHYLEGFEIDFEISDNLLTIEGKTYKARNKTEAQLAIANVLSQHKITQESTALGPKAEAIRYGELARYLLNPMPIFEVKPYEK